MSADIMAWARTEFIAEALDLLPELDRALLGLEAEPGSTGLVNPVFRAIHTIKGSGAMAGFPHLARFAHRLEEAFDAVRAGRLAVSTELIECGLKACDVIRELLEMEGEPGETAAERAVTQALSCLLPQTAVSKTEAMAPSPTPPRQPASPVRTAYEITFRPDPDLFRSGMDPAPLLDQLRALGSAHITARTDQVPPLSSLDPESCCLWWEILLVTDRGETAIKEVFEFVEECEIDVRIREDDPVVPAESLDPFLLECGVHLASIEISALALRQEPASPAAKPVGRETIQAAPDTRDTMRGLLESVGRRGLGLAAFKNTASQCAEMIGGCLRNIESGGGATASGIKVIQTYLRSLKTLATAASYQKCPGVEQPVALQLAILNAALQTGGALDQEDKARLKPAFRSACSAVDQVTRESGNLPRETPPAAPTTIRVEQEKLDRLMRLVGELLVARGAFPVLASKLAGGSDASLVARELKEAGAGISHIADELQSSIMSIRMLPLRTVFQKFPRLVRDLAVSLGKEARLIVEGESIELDKTILEQIGDPLMHLIRNAVDHGLETPEERKRLGKDPVGRITLRARNEVGTVVIEVKDDGPGLDAAALKRKAIENGLLSLDAAALMDETAAFQLVFLPGLSTARTVNGVSGRGVGMDVVANNIRGLQGTIDIRSTRGGRTAFSVRIPTSLMVSKGILLETASEEYILPLGSIREMVKIPAKEIHEHNGSRIARIRDEIYSIVSLAELFRLPLTEAPEVSIAIVEAGKVSYGLMVDRFVSEIEVIVKPLAGGLEGCREFQGAAIMGDGRLVLVLNAFECHRLQT